MPKWGERIPKPKLHRPSGQARIRVDGKEIYLGRWDSAEARRRYAQFLREWAEARAAGPTMEPERPLTVSVAVFRFWTWAEARYRHPDGTPTREAENFKAALRPLRKLFGELPLVELGPARLYELQAHMGDSGLARKTVNARINKVRRFVRWSVGRELCPASLATALAAVESLREGQGVRGVPRTRPGRLGGRGGHAAPPAGAAPGAGPHLVVDRGTGG